MKDDGLDKSRLSDPAHMRADEGLSAYQSLRQRNEERCVRMAMTLLLSLLVPSLILTALAISRYGLVVTVLCIVLVLFFACFAWFVQATVLQNQSRVFHPYIHAVTDAIATELKNFQDDWRQEILMIEDSETTQTSRGVDQEGSHHQHPKLSSKRRPKSVFFKIIVKPFAHILKRTKRKRNTDDNTSYQVELV